ncbi:GNAT family N-acetyltransferase [Dyadobacter sp. 3J3]|uniref:GNAT family N-acetyltransferase n=1 Tax=Dyadobacter sp. 3J3 TaxID=2606600 RepID=UPI001356C859|nr:GNAT family N-acetyltransferase [Dyadobacter sp. 3J3]
MTLPILLPRSEIIDERWNELITKSEQSIIYANSWYLDVVCDNWKAIVWPSADDYQIVMPLPIKRKWNIEVVQQPLFCQYLGLFSIDKISEQQLYLFLKKLSSSFSYISSYHFHPDHSAILSDVFHHFPKFEVKHNHTYWLSLSDSLPDIQLKYSSDRKANLKRGEKFDWIIKPSEDIEPLIQLFRDHHAAGISGGVSEKAYEILSCLFNALKINSAANVFYAEKDGRINAGALFVKADKMVIFLFNAADLIGRKENARTVLLDHYFKLYAGKSLSFDFESPEIKKISSFYKSFGASPVPYFSIRKNDLPFPFKQIQNWRVKKSLKSGTN